MSVDVFSNIYKNNLWKSEESFSGPSSTLARTVQLRKELPQIFSEFGIKNLLDAPCGDLNWMREILETEINLNYIGCDIVEELIIKNQALYISKENISFKCIDITKDELPQADLMLCRDCLFHLSYEDVISFLENFINSEIPLLLTTTHLNPNKFENKNIKTGGWRWMDLFAFPYKFPVNPIYRFNDGNDREMCMWTKNHVSEALRNLRLGCSREPV